MADGHEIPAAWFWPNPALSTTQVAHHCKVGKKTSTNHAPAAHPGNRRRACKSSSQRSLFPNNDRFDDSGQNLKPNRASQHRGCLLGLWKKSTFGVLQRMRFLQCPWGCPKNLKGSRSKRSWRCHPYWEGTVLPQHGSPGSEAEECMPTPSPRPCQSHGLGSVLSSPECEEVPFLGPVPHDPHCSPVPSLQQSGHQAPQLFIFNEFNKYGHRLQAIHQ